MSLPALSAKQTTRFLPFLSNRLTIDHNRYLAIVSQVNFLLLHFGTSSFYAANRPDPVPAISLTSLQAVPTVSAFSSIVLTKPFISLPPLHCPWVFQLKACFSEAEKFLLSLCPIHIHFRSLVSTDIAFPCARLHILLLRQLCDTCINS
jgi:hypothetical protein